MCDHSDKLILWLDRELPQDEAADLQRHLQTCAECRRCLAAYQRVNDSIDAYCDAAIESPVRQRLPGWAPVLAAAAAVLFLLVAHGHIATGPRERPLPSAPVTAASSPTLAHHNEGQPEVRAALNPPPAPVHKRSRTIPAVSLVQGEGSTQQTKSLSSAQNANWIPAQAAVEIAIPAEAMFAPGAVPQGISFSAELVIAPDGSAQQLRLRP
jgi:anti-sigma factor RsiW